MMERKDVDIPEGVYFILNLCIFILIVMFIGLCLSTAREYWALLEAWMAL